MKRGIWGLSLALFCAFLTSCSQKYALDAYQPPSQKLSRSAAVYIMTPADGSYGARAYPNSGRATAQALYTSLSAVTNKIDLGAPAEPLEAALANARAKNAAYVFQPIILNWEDHATEWSGRPDRITIKLVVYEAQSGEDISSVLARSSSKWGTFGGDHPQDLLPLVMRDFTNKLF